MNTTNDIESRELKGLEAEVIAEDCLDHINKSVLDFKDEIKELGELHCLVGYDTTQLVKGLSDIFFIHFSNCLALGNRNIPFISNTHQKENLALQLTRYELTIPEEINKFIELMKLKTDGDTYIVGT